MKDNQPVISQLLCTAPLLFAGLIGGQMSGTEGSCVATAFAEKPISYATEQRVSPSTLVRGYQIVSEKNLLYSMTVVEKLWNYFVNEAEHLSPEHVEVIDKEFWNLG